MKLLSPLHFWRIWFSGIISETNNSGESESPWKIPDQDMMVRFYLKAQENILFHSVDTECKLFLKIIFLLLNLEIFKLTLLILRL